MLLAFFPSDVNTDPITTIFLEGGAISAKKKIPKVKKNKLKNSR